MSAAHRRATTKHIAVLAFPFGAHASSILRLVRRLSEAAPDVRFSFLSTPESNDSIFSGSSSNWEDRVKRCDIGDGLPEGYVFGGKQVPELVELFLKGAAERFKKGMEAAAAEMGEEIGCLISDAFYWFVGEMGVEMKVPWVAVWTSGPRLLFVHLQTDFIRENVKAGSGSKDLSLDFLPGFSSMRVADLPVEVMSTSLDSPFPSLLHKMGHHLPQATSVLINSFEEIDTDIHNPLNSTLPNYLNIGPLFDILAPLPPPSDAHGCLPWLDNHPPKSVAYIGFGSFVTPPLHELTALADALQESGLPFLWSLRGNAEEQLPKEVLEGGRGKIVPWAPQVEILKHSSVGVFVTHGGWNSVLESIAGGLPMIGRPFMGDQRMNMKTVENVWGIGVGLEGGVVTKSGVLKALGQVLGNEEGKLMREKVGILQALAHKAAESTGSSSRNLRRLVEMVLH